MKKYWYKIYILYHFYYLNIIYYIIMYRKGKYFYLLQIISKASQQNYSWYSYTGDSKVIFKK